MSILSRGRFGARLAESAADIAAAQALRGICFATPGPDRDRFDALCDHVLVEDLSSGQLVCCFRLLATCGARLAGCYSAQFYDLSALEGFSGGMAELGRFCIHPERRDPDILRLAWGAMTRRVDRDGIALLFGCTSFQGTDAGPYGESFALLARHLAPPRWQPGIKAPSVVRFALASAPDPVRATKMLPPLLRTYLAMGGWVSDHAVVDAHMNTLHVFTAVEIARVPANRARLLRAVAG